MKKNNLIWIIALFLVILTLPGAHAQSLFGSFNLPLVLINSAIVGIVLFILQTFLMPGKADKEKTAVYVAIIAGSLLIGFMFGSQNWIWTHPLLAKFLNMYVLVNALVITVVAYFILGLMKFQEKIGASKEGLGGFAILLFITALVISLYIGNKFIWQVATIQQFIGYLFGNEGILNPKPPEYRLWVFLTSFVLLGYFFSVYIGQKLAGSKFITYALAATLAASMATAGVGLGVVIKIAEFIFLIIIADALDGKIKDGKYQWGLAFLVVGWSSASLTAAFGPQYEGVIGSFMAPILRYYGIINTTGPTGFGPLLLSPPVLLLVTIFIAMDFVAKEDGYFHKIGEGGVIVWVILLLMSNGFSIGFGNWGFVGLWILIPIAVIVGLIMIISRAGNRSKWWNEGATRLKKEIRNKISRNRFLNSLLGRFAGLRDPTLDNEIPFKLKELRFEIYTMMNYMLRHDVWYSKSESFKLTVEKVKEEEGRLQEMDPISDGPGQSMKKQIQGTKIEKDETKKPIWTQEEYGMAKPYFIVNRIPEILKDRLQGDLITYNAEREEEEKRSALENLGTQVETYKTNIEQVKSRYQSAFERFGRTSVLRSYRRFFLDMYNMYGKYERGYHFAKEDAIPDYYGYSVEAGDGIIRKIKLDKDPTIIADRSLTRKERLGLRRIGYKKKEHLKPDEIQLVNKADALRAFYKNNKLNFEKDGEHLAETTLFGKCLSDWNSVSIDGASKIQVPFIRFYPSGEIWELYRPANKGDPVRFHVMFDWASKDWHFAQDDMARGTYHYFSKKIGDYDFIDKEGLLDYSMAKFKGPKLQTAVAFDREGLKSLHQFHYWGRREFYDEQGTNLQVETGIVNPYPTITVLGLWMFIRSVVRRKILEPEIQKKFLQDFQQEYEQIDKIEKGGSQGGAGH